MALPSLKHVAAFALASTVLVACGKESISLDAADRGNQQINRGAQIFADKCAGCHTLDPAGTQGSATKVRDRERVDGPNFNVRPEDRQSILYAIRNGGFSGAIMPENIIVGRDAQDVATFLAKYAGRQAQRPSTPSSSNAPGSATP